MTVTLHPWPSLNAYPIERFQFASNAWDMIPKANPEYGSMPKSPGDILQSSYGPDGLPSSVIPSTNGLVYATIYAYSQHHHLVLRPEDIWFAIITQFSYFVNGHAEDLRKLFVAHEEKKELRINYVAPNRFMFDYSLFADDMSRLVQENIVDPELREWIMPSFTTTTRNDEVVAAIIMMGTLQKYFDYVCGIVCGLPSVTLQGERKDYDDILARLDKFSQFGDEPTQFAAQLRPVIQRFADSFDNPTSSDIEQFWRQILSIDDSICGITLYTGWLTKFLFWDDKGEQLHRIGGAVESKNIVPGWTRVPIIIDDHGEIVKAEMTAGSLGIRCSNSKDGQDSDAKGLDTMQPLTGWWIHQELEEKNVSSGSE